jgi:hypothetical protein
MLISYVYEFCTSVVQISNFEYLMQLNTLAGRSYNDITQVISLSFSLSLSLSLSHNILILSS